MDVLINLFKFTSKITRALFFVKLILLPLKQTNKQKKTWTRIYWKLVFNPKDHIASTQWVLRILDLSIFWNRLNNNLKIFWKHRYFYFG